MTRTYEHIMLDLETMGTRPGSAIVAIGAVAFDLDSGELGPEFECRITLQSCVASGLEIDPDTLEWWLRQSDAARGETFAGVRFHLGNALPYFANWLHAVTRNVKVWGNGAAFDNALLTEAYKRYPLQLPWQWWNDRCYRTIKTLNEHVAPPPFEGTPHNALDDARHQARHLIEILARPREHIEIVSDTPQTDTIEA